MLYVFSPTTFEYENTIETPDRTHENYVWATEVAPPPAIPMTRRVFDIEKREWEYAEAFHPPDHNPKEPWLDSVMTYAEIRAKEYPPIHEYVDGVVKQDEAQVNAYLQKCRDVKAAWPKDMPPITIRELYVRKGIFKCCNSAEGTNAESQESREGNQSFGKILGQEFG